MDYTYFLAQFKTYLILENFIDVYRAGFFYPSFTQLFVKVLDRISNFMITIGCNDYSILRLTSCNHDKQYLKVVDYKSFINHSKLGILWR